MTTKIVALTDALGNLVRFVLLPGQRYDTLGVAPLIEGIEFGALIADKAFDANWIIAEMNTRGAGIVISQRQNRLNPIPIDLAPAGSAPRRSPRKPGYGRRSSRRAPGSSSPRHR